MILADKIIKLRKQFGWSQENLADALDVSRQSVSKWESGNSIPDLTKILKMAELFGVSTDYLLKDDLENFDSSGIDSDPKVVKLTLEEVNQYVELKVKASKLISKGVLILIYAVIPLFLMLAISESQMLSISGDAAVLVGLTLMLIIVASGISILIHSNQYKHAIDDLNGDFELSYGIEGVYREKLHKYLPTFTRTVTIAVVTFILSVLPLLYAGLISNSDTLPLFMLIVLIFFVGLGVYQLILVNARKNAYEKILKQGDYEPEKAKELKQEEQVGAFYWPLVVAIYLGWSLLTHDWHITWIVWPVAGLVFAALLGFIQLVAPKKK